MSAYVLSVEMANKNVEFPIIIVTEHAAVATAASTAMYLRRRYTSKCTVIRTRPMGLDLVQDNNVIGKVNIKLANIVDHRTYSVVQMSNSPYY